MIAPSAIHAHERIHDVLDREDTAEARHLLIEINWASLPALFFEAGFDLLMFLIEDSEDQDYKFDEEEGDGLVLAYSHLSLQDYRAYVTNPATYRLKNWERISKRAAWSVFNPVERVGRLRTQGRIPLRPDNS